MSKKVHTNFEDLLAFFHRKKKGCPKGVSLKLQNHKYLMFQFVLPGTDKRSTRGSGEPFTEEGIIMAVNKAYKIKEALLTSTEVNDFWEWYDSEILKKNKINNTLKTYREIFCEIENEYFSGHHKNTGERRSRDKASFRLSYQQCKGKFFNKIKNWDKCPDWESIQEALYIWEQGSKTFKDAYYAFQDVATRAGDKQVLKKMSEINPKQTIKEERQSCSWDDFYTWHQKCLSEANQLPKCEADDRRSWLWVVAMCVVYGLRPSEAAAIKNLKESWVKDDVIIPPIRDPENENLLLVIGDYTYFGASTKTGQRITRPMVTDDRLWNDLRLRDAMLPEIDFRFNIVSDGSLITAFSNRLNHRLRLWNAPVTQAYAFRHLSNQLGEKYGIPQEIRARMLGHSVAVNDAVYKSRHNLKTEIDLLLNHKKEIIDRSTAEEKIKIEFSNLSDDTVKGILKIIYD